MKFTIFLSISIIFFLGLSCSNKDSDNDECIRMEVGYVTSVNSPSEGEINKRVDIQLKFPVYSGCGGFGQFLETVSENSRIIEVEAKYQGCLCTTDVPIITITYEFITDKAGQYELNFKSTEAEFITVILNIS